MPRPRPDERVREPYLTETRKTFLTALIEAGGTVEVTRGSVSAKMAELIGTSNRSSVTHLVTGLAEDGVIAPTKTQGRTIKGITLVEPAPSERFQRHIDATRAALGLDAGEEPDDAAGKETDVLSRLQAVQADIDARTATTPSPAEAPEIPVPGDAPAPEPEPSPAATTGGDFDYDKLAGHLLDRVARVLGEDTSALQAQIATLSAEIDHAQHGLWEAREESTRWRAKCQRLETENRELGDQVAALRRQVDGLRYQVRERDDNIKALVQEHSHIASRAVSEASRRNLDRTLREASPAAL